MTEIQQSSMIESFLQRIHELESPHAGTMEICQMIWKDIALSGLDNEVMLQLSHNLMHKVAEIREFDPKAFNTLPIVAPQSCEKQTA